MGDPGVAVVVRPGQQRPGNGTAILLLDHLLAGGRIGHVLLLGGHRGAVVAVAAGERNGSHQRERQCHEPNESKSHSAPPCIGMADLRPANRVLVAPVTPAFLRFRGRSVTHPRLPVKEAFKCTAILGDQVVVAIGCTGCVAANRWECWDVSSRITATHGGASCETI